MANPLERFESDFQKFKSKRSAVATQKLRPGKFVEIQTEGNPTPVKYFVTDEYDLIKVDKPVERR